MPRVRGMLPEDASPRRRVHALQTAALLGPEHPESHFNLALVYQRRRMLADAEREVLCSLRLSPGQADARNLLAVIFVQQGEMACARSIWDELIREAPEFTPARINLTLLGGPIVAAADETAAVPLPRAAAVEANSKG